MPKEGKYALEVPLDASGVEQREAGRPIKVLLQLRGGDISSQTTKLDEKGHASVRFDFQQPPGALRVIVGPGDAGDDELVGLQTIAVDVPQRVWRQPLLKLKPILISPYFWFWWLRWCRTFTIRGVLRCPDGSPVPGAKVCAYDVDWWWWWTSTQQIGCATTDANGAFEMRFKWCCGWWPWWWWQQRYWSYEPKLLERIAPVLQRDEQLTPLLKPAPVPSLAAFEKLLAQEAGPRQPLPSEVEPAALSGLRDRLLKRLPAAPELEKLRLWPWYPWTPWWDCTPDVIFRATQDCEQGGVVVLEETIWDARWDIPTTLDVTLQANDKACCVPPAHGCSEGDCLALTEVCSSTLDQIGGNPGAPAGPAGYLNPDPAPAGALRDRPFGGAIDLSGTSECMTGVDYYAFEFKPEPAGTWAPVPPPSARAFVRSYVDFGPPLTFSHPAFAPALIDGKYVYETIQHYEANNDPADWASLNRVWLSSRDLLMRWQTEGTIADGLYRLRVRGWNVDAAGHLVNGRILEICESESDAELLLTVDNRLVAPGPVDAHGFPCGSGTVHTCTDEPTTAIVATSILHADGSVTPVSPCGNVPVNDGDHLQVDFVAHDPDGHLSRFTLEATYDVNLATDLLALPGATLTPLGGTFAPAAAQVGPTYDAARADGAVAPVWNGGAMRLTVKATGAGGAFPYTCCYQLELRAHKRTVVSCDYSDWGHTNTTEHSFTVSV